MLANIGRNLTSLSFKTYLQFAIVSGFTLGLLFSFLYFALSARAAVRTWDGGGANENWSTCANWSTDTCPTTGDSVVFDGTSTKNVTIDASAVASVTGMTISAGYTGTITVARTFSITTFSQAAGNFTASNQTVTFSSIALSNGSFTASSGTTIVNGTFNITGGSFAHNSGTMRFSGSTATLTCNNVSFNAVSFTGQTNTKTISSNCTLPLGAAPTIPDILVLNGTLTGTGTLTSNNNLTLNSTASLSGFSGLNQTSGTLTLSNYAESFASYSPFTAGAITVSAGNLTLPATASSGTVTMSSGTLNAPSTLWTITGGMSLSGSAALVHNNGTITFTGALNPTIACNNQTFHLVNINWTGNGGSTISSNCNLPLGNNPTITNGSSSRAFNLNGTLSGTGTLTFTSSTGTTMTISSTGSLSGFSGLSMAGITVAGTTIDLSSYSPLTMGTLILSSGSLTVPSGLALSGTLQVSGGTFNAPSGNLTVGIDLTVTGSPTFNHNGGTITLNGSSPTITCTGTIFNKVVISASNSTTISSACNVPLGNNPTMLNDVILNGTLSGTGTLTQTNGELIVQGSGALTGFTEYTGTNNALTVTSTTLNMSAFTRVHMEGSFVLSNSSSHFSAPQLLEIGGGVSFGGGTFTHNNGTVNFFGGSAGITCSTQSFFLVTLTGQTGTKTFTGCALPLGSNPTIPVGLTTNSAITGSGTLTHTSGTLTLNTGASVSGFSGLTGTSNALTVEGATANFSSFSSFSINGTTQLNSGTVTFPPNATLNGSLSIVGATMASTTGDLTVTGNVTASSGTLNAPSGVFTIGGALSFSGSANFVHNSGTVNFTGSGVSLTCNSKTFNLVTLNNTGTLTIQSSCSFPLGNNPTVANSVSLSGTLSGTGTLSMTTGTLTLNSTANLSGFSGLNGSALTTSLSTFDASSYATFTTSGLVTVSAGTLTLPANASVAGLTLTGAANLAATSGDVTINGTLTMNSSGTVTAPTGTLYLSGNFVHTSGTYTHNNGTINFNGTSQTLSGISTSFYNVTKQLGSAAAQTLTFPGGSTITTTINGTLTLHGYDTSNRLSLRSSNVNQYRLSPLGSVSLLYIDLKDANNVSGTTIQMGGTGSLDSTNNTNFNFNSLTPNDPTSLGPSNVISAVIVGTATPTFTFTLSDPNPLDTMRYQLQISQQSDFSTSVVDYSSALGAQGSKSFTVGQPPGSGSYAVGSSSQTLATGNYYWRVRAYDNSGQVSNYVAGNNGSMAFAIDADAPSAFTPTLNVSSPTTNQTPTLTFSTTDNVAVSHYRVKIDSGVFSTQSSPYQLPTLSEGSHTITVRAIDTSNNIREEEITLVVDLSQPASFTPTLNVTSPTSNQTPTLTFSTTDNDGINRYEVKIDSGSFSTQTSPYQLPSLNEGSHTITVRAYDTAENFRDGTVAVTIDITPPNSFTPTLDVTSPTSETRPTISFSTTDATGVTAYQVKIDDGSYSTQTSPYHVPTLSLGDHTITVKAIDGAGNERTGWVDVTVISGVDTPPADFTPTFSPGNPTNDLSPSVLFSTTDDLGIDHYEVKIDAGSFSTQTSPYQLPTLSEGSYTITVRAFDTTNQTTDGTAILVIDQTSPANFTPGFAVSSPTNDRTPTLTFSTTDNVAVDHFEISINSGSFITHSSPYTLPSQADGVVSVIVRAFDGAGNYSEGNTSILIDGTAPSVFTPTLNVSSPTTDTSPILSFATTDANGIDSYEVRIDDGSYSTQISPYQLPTLSEGEHTIYVQATDTAGNTRVGTVTFTIDLNGPADFSPTLDVISPTNNVAPIVSFTTTDDQGIDYYELKIDNGTFSTQTSPYQLPTLASGSHTVTVRAYDILGNYTDGTVTFVIDTTGPAISISAPTKISHTDITNVSVVITDINGVDVDAVSWSGGVLVCDQHSVTQVTCQATITSSGNVQVDATDLAGNSSQEFETDFIIETTAPTISVSAPTKITLAAITDTTIQVTDNVGLYASDVSAVSGGTITCQQTTSTQVDCSAIIRYSGNLVINALDFAGNAQAVTETGYEINNTPPSNFTPTLNTESTTSNPAPILFFSTTDTDGIDYYLVQIDDQAFSQQISPYQVPSLSDGVHTLRIRAVDIHGNFTDGVVTVTINQVAASPTPSPTPTPTPTATPSSTEASPNPSTSSTPNPTPTTSSEGVASPNPTPQPTESGMLDETLIATTTSPSTNQNNLINALQTPPSTPPASAIAARYLTQVAQQNPQWQPVIQAGVQVVTFTPPLTLLAAALLQSLTMLLLTISIFFQMGMSSITGISSLLTILSAVGLVPVKKRNAFVHQTKSGEPIPFAIISIYAGSNPSGRLFSTLVSDIHGTFTEPTLPPGTYVFQAAHATHIFPSKYPRPAHLSPRSYYQGEALTYQPATTSPALLIPMDPRSESQQRKEYVHRLLLTINQLRASLSFVLYPASALSGLAFLINPTWSSSLIMLIYAVVLAQRITSHMKHPTISGRLITTDSHLKLANVSIILSTLNGEVVSIVKTDKRGTFHFFVQPGEYSAIIQAQHLRLPDTQLGTLLTINTNKQQSRQLKVVVTRVPTS